MTSGNRDIGTVTGYPPTDLTTFGTIHQVVWSGQDWPRRPKSPKEYYQVQRGNRLYKVRVLARATEPPPKRRSDDEHQYSKTISWRRNEVATQTFPTPTGTSTTDTSTCILQAGAGYNPSGFMLQPAYTANDELKLFDKLREKIVGTGFDASVFLAEAGESLQLIGDTAIRVTKMYHHLVRGDIVGAARAVLEGTGRQPLKQHRTVGKAVRSGSRDLASDLLAIRYGWAPLLDDTYNAAEFLAHYLSVPLEARYKVSRVYNKKGDAFIYQGYYPYPAGNNSLPYYGTKTAWTRVDKLRLVVWVRENPSLIAQLGLNDPSLAVWEKIPFSFVADWFIPIGAWLGARGITSLVKGKYVQSYFSHGKAHAPRGVRCPDGALAGFVYPSGHIQNVSPAWQERVGVTRLVGDAPSVPLPEFKPLGKALSWIHTQNAVALLVSGFSRK